MAAGQWRVDASESGQRLDKFLSAPSRLASRGRAAEALDRGQVFVNDAEQTAADASRRVREGDLVRLWRDRPGSAQRRTRARRLGGFTVLFEDEALIVVDKPPGVLTVPLPAPDGELSVVDGLDAEYAARTRRAPLVVHRIDRDTSGLVIFARTRLALTALREQFRRREPVRVYLAVVNGVPEPPAGTWRDWVRWNDRACQLQSAPRSARGAVEAACVYEVQESYAHAALIEVRLITGRQNQIRAQALLHGHPLVGEQKYTARDAPSRIAFQRQALHAHQLAFAHPLSGRPVSFESPLPPDLDQLLGRLRGAR